MKEKILIIDDEAGIRNSLASFLKLEEYAVDTAENGKEALEKIRANRYGIVLLDINMPGMSGIDTLQAIKAFEFSCQVIMMTGSGHDRKNNGLYGVWRNRLYTQSRSKVWRRF